MTFGKLKSTGLTGKIIEVWLLNKVLFVRFVKEDAFRKVGRKEGGREINGTEDQLLPVMLE